MEKKVKDVHKSDFIYNQGFSCFYTNADQLRNKMNELRTIAQNTQPKIICVCEVKPKHATFTLNESEIEINNYNMFNNSLENNDERGIVVYVHKSIEANEITITPNRESVWLHIKLNNKDVLLVGCLYRSPSNTMVQDNQFLSMVKTMTASDFTHLLIMGDFNLKKINWNTWESSSKDVADISNRFIEVLRDAFLYQHVTKPTRSRHNEVPTLLDLVITNEDGMVSNLEILSPLGKSDHSCITFWFNCYIEHKKTEIEKYIYDKGNYEQIKDDLRSIDWEKDIRNRRNINDKWNYIKQKIQDSCDAHIPKRKFNPNKKVKFKNSLDLKSIAKIKKKHKSWKKYMNNRTSDNYKEFCKMRNQVRNLTRKAKKEKEGEIAADAKSNPKKFWKYVNNNLKTKPGIPNLEKTTSTKDKKEVTKNDKEKADTLLNYFSSVFTIEPDGHIPDIEMKKTNTKLEEINITEEAVKKKLKNLNANKSPGPDKIHPRILKELHEPLSKPLTLLFRDAVKLEEIPDEWKTATVSAIFKKGQKNKPQNYRPVSLTCICCKLLETFIRDDIVHHMKENKLFSNSQFGFIGGRSTVLQLLHVLEKWTDTLDQGGVLDVIYLDFMKAFDKVPHKRLIAKLKSYGIGNKVTNWIDFYLSGRRQRVCVNGTYSDWAPVTSGIPQGSVLGPVLFTIYINDLPDEITSDIYLFADDTKIFTEIKSDEDVQKLQHDLNKLQEWSNKWLLKFHPEKCKVLDISIRGKLEYEYYLDDVKLSHTNTEKDLGVHIDNRLKFDSHIGTKINKANNVLGAIRRTFTFLDKTTLMRLYTSMVRPHLEYANQIWHPRYKKDIASLENVQKRATKLIPEIKDLSYKERLQYLKLPTLPYRRLRGDMIETYKLTHGVYDDTLPDILPKYKDIIGNPGRTRGHSLKLYKRKHRIEVRKHNFTMRVVEPWNSLPEKVVNAPSVNSFERRLDKYWANQGIRYDFKKCIKFNRMPEDDIYSDDSESEEDLVIED